MTDNHELDAPPGCTVHDLMALAESGRRFGVLLADPPWIFQTYSEKGKETRSPERHYQCLTPTAIAALPVPPLASKHCALFLWATMPHLPTALELMCAWGFTYKTVGFTWVKTTKNARGISCNGDGLHWGTGYWTRANAELCLVGARGAPKRQAKDVHQVIVSPVGEHSRKPLEVHTRIERLLPGPYLELFARRPRPGWTVWGDEIPRDAMDGGPLSALAIPLRADEPDLFDGLASRAFSGAGP